MLERRRKARQFGFRQQLQEAIFAGLVQLAQRARPRRALARQLTRLRGSPWAHGRMSANSIPSPFLRDTSLPAKTCVSRGCSARRSISSRVSVRSESIAGDEDWQVLVTADDELSKVKAI